KRYGLEHLRTLAKADGAKVMPRPDIGPTICQLRLQGSAVSLLRRIPLRGDSGRAISGLPIPAGAADVEPAFDLTGAPLGTDPSGADTEAIVALSDGTFWIGDEYGPSLMQVGPEGRVLQRWVPKGRKRTSACRSSWERSRQRRGKLSMQPLPVKDAMLALIPS